MSPPSHLLSFSLYSALSPDCRSTPSVVKTRMQSIHAKQEYRNALHCAYRIFTEEGVTRFWKGTVPRLGRLIVSLPSASSPIYTNAPAERRHHLLSVRKSLPCRRGRCTIASVPAFQSSSCPFCPIRHAYTVCHQRSEIQVQDHPGPSAQLPRREHAHVDRLGDFGHFFLFAVFWNRRTGQNHDT